MRLEEKIKSMLEYKITIDLNAKLYRKKAYRIIGLVSVTLLILGYVIGETMFWGVDDRSVFDRQIEALGQTSKKSDHRSKVDLALAYYLKGEAEDAEELLEEVLQYEKEDAPANIYYGLILADRKQYRDAIPYLLRGIRKEPQREKLAYIYLGISYYELGGYNEALTYLDTGIKLDPGSALGHYYLGLVFNKKGDRKNAAAALMKALELSGNNYPEAARELKSITGK